MLDLVAPLTALRDIAGVSGSFVVSSDGKLVARDLPAVFDDRVLTDAGPRILRLWDALSSVAVRSAGAAPDDSKAKDYCMIKFSEHRLYVREILGGKLAIVADAGANLPALKMAANLVVRSLNTSIKSHLSVASGQTPDSQPPSGGPEPTRSSAPPPADEAVPSSKRARTLVYRGRRYGA